MRNPLRLRGSGIVIRLVWWHELKRLTKLVFNMHSHDWGRPYRNTDGTIIQTCYGCSRDRRVEAEVR